LGTEKGTSRMVERIREGNEEENMIKIYYIPV
jgi:hypothetical protein